MYRYETRNRATWSLLTRNQWRVFIRTLQARQRPWIWGLLGFFSLYIAFILTTFGFYFDRFLPFFAPGQTPIAVVNANIVPVLASLFGVRFLIQKTPNLKLKPYRHLPIRENTLVGFFQATSLLSLHNVFPLLFFVPFWFRFVLPNAPTLVGAWSWLGGVLLLIAASNYGTLLVRSLMTHRTPTFLAFLAGTLVLSAFDQWSGLQLTNHASTALFNGLLLNKATVALLLLLVAGWCYLASTFNLRSSLRSEPVSTRRLAATAIPWHWAERIGPLGQMIALEGKMMLRNRRPQHYALIALLFSTVYLIFLLANPNVYGGPLLGAIIGLFASGGFVLNYGQLMFAWESTHFDALLTRPLTLRRYLQAKLVLLQASCLLFFFVSLPFFLWLAPHLLGLHVAFLFYNAGITCLLVLVLAVRNRRRINVDRSGGFFNYEGFSMMHWLWFIPTTLPPIILLLIFFKDPALAWWSLGGMGFISLLAFPIWSALFTNQLVRRRYDMAEGFRRDDH